VQGRTLVDGRLCAEAELLSTILDERQATEAEA
jgi:hypothetical protein